jgi:hypothetical protein
MTEYNYSNYTITRYTQISFTVHKLYEQTFNKKYIFPQTLFEESDNIIKLLLDKYNITTVVTYISGILWKIGSLYNDNNHDKDYVDKLIQIYQIHQTKLKKQIEKDNIGIENTLTEKEKRNFLYWEEIIKVYNTLLDNLDRCNYSLFLDFVIIALYVLHPPTRADYANMYIFSDDSQVPSDIKENYCVLQTNPRFVFNNYKTSKTKGTAIITIDNSLHDILLDWVCINKSNFLLASYNSKNNTYKALSENNLANRIKYIFMKQTNKSASINTLRHSFISYNSKYDQNVINKQSNANKMMHSVEMADKYRRYVY